MQWMIKTIERVFSMRFHAMNNCKAIIYTRRVCCFVSRLTNYLKSMLSVPAKVSSMKNKRYLSDHIEFNVSRCIYSDLISIIKSNQNTCVFFSAVESVYVQFSISILLNFQIITNCETWWNANRFQPVDMVHRLGKSLIPHRQKRRKNRHFMMRERREHRSVKYDVKKHWSISNTERQHQETSKSNSPHTQTHEKKRMK